MLLYTSSSVYGAVPYTRIEGKDRYDTAFKVYKNIQCDSGYAVIVSGREFADALCAAPLTREYSAPLFLTDGDRLSDNVVEEIKKIVNKEVFLVGGTSSISLQVEEQLTAMGKKYERLGGKDRYETSVKVAEKIKGSGSAVVASGENFADAVSVSVAAAILNMPILLTEKDELSDAVYRYIQNNIQKSFIIGGPGSVGDMVEKQLKSPERLYGKDRYETNKVITDRFKDFLDFERIYIVSGTDFPDALSSSVLAQQKKSPVFLISEGMEKEQYDYLKTIIASAKEVTVIGGKGAVSHQSLYLVGLEDKPEEKPQNKAQEKKQSIPILSAWSSSITVLNADELTPVYVKKNPKSDAPSKGYQYGSLPEVSILDKEGDYYHIQYKNYGSSADSDGYVPIGMVKTVKTDEHYIVLVELSKQKVSIFKDSVLLKEITCSTGADPHGTPTGRFLIGSKGYYFITKDGNVKCYYWVRFDNNYLFHSVLCDLSGNIIKSEEAKLGSKASHGCIRLPFDEAKWFYDNIPSNTLVTIQ